MEGYQQGMGGERMEGKVQGTRSIIGRYKIERGRLRIVWEPWLVGLSGLSTRLRSRGSLVQFPVGACDWVVGQVPFVGPPEATTH